MTVQFRIWPHEDIRGALNEALEISGATFEQKAEEWGYTPEQLDKYIDRGLPLEVRDHIFRLAYLTDIMLVFKYGLNGRTLEDYSPYSSLLETGEYERALDEAIARHARECEEAARTAHHGSTRHESGDQR